MLMPVEDQGLQNGDGVEVLELGGVKDGEIDRECVSALVGAAAEDDLAKDDRLAEGLLGMVVRGRHAVDFEEGEEAVVITLRIEEAQAQAFRVGVRDRGGAEGMEFVVEFRDARFGGEEADPPRVALTAKLTETGEETAELPAEGDGGDVGFADG